MTFVAFLDSLNETELADYAARCQTTPGYLVAHLKSARKVPRGDLLNRLWVESRGAVDRNAVLTHFFPAPATQAN